MYIFKVKTSLFAYNYWFIGSKHMYSLFPYCTFSPVDKLLVMKIVGTLLIFYNNLGVEDIASLVQMQEVPNRLWAFSV